jgi:hypothetical protein
MRIKFTSNDQLLSMSDDQLREYKNMLDHLIHVRRRKNVETLSYEHEMSWVQREHGVRLQRKKLHHKYTTSRIKSKNLR